MQHNEYTAGKNVTLSDLRLERDNNDTVRESPEACECAYYWLLDLFNGLCCKRAHELSRRQMRAEKGICPNHFVQIPAQSRKNANR